MMASYAELQVTTNFSFLRGGSHPDELVDRAVELGLSAIGVVDHHTLAGMVRSHVAAKAAKLRLLVGARVDPADGPSLLCYPENRAAYGRLCRLLSLGQLRAPKGGCLLDLEDVIDHAEGLVMVGLPPSVSDEKLFSEGLSRLRRGVDGPLYLAAHMLYRGDDRARLCRLAGLARRHGIGLVATNDVRYHDPGRQILYDVLTAIREGVPVRQAGRRLSMNAENHLKSPAEMARLFRDYPEAVGRTAEIVERCTFSLDEIAYEYPDEPVPEGRSAQAYLAELTYDGAAERYPDGVPETVRTALENELKLISELDYARYFLTVYDIVRFARSRGILCQGRGSAANSAVCYCLGITSVDPSEIDLLFERFVSRERQEPPDIDVDFEHERREEVIQYLYRRYGRDRAGLAATVVTYRERSAIREVGKVMGLSEDTITVLAKTSLGRRGEGWPGARLRESGLDPADPLLDSVLRLANELIGFPRHLSQHVGGFVLTRVPLNEMVPIGNAAMAERTFIEWDKDDLEALGLMKVDILGLGMLSCIRKAFELLARHKGIGLQMATVPGGDPAVYDMICRADTLGVFQIESRAQMNMLPRLKPRCFYDLVIEVAIVRPGPIQGDMVHPYLRRRSGVEKVVYPSPSPEHGPQNELEKVLKKTLGVPLFQEQAMRIAMEAARFTPDEANALRHSMATFRRRGTLSLLRDKMVGRMIDRGYDRELAERCFRQIEGFGEYGFPESHAASFSLLVYVSSWLKHHHPEVFSCALLNSQPMGFYAPAQIVRDAREHGVEVRPVDVNDSHWDNTLEHMPDGQFALRLGLRRINGLNSEEAARIIALRDRSYADLEDLRRRTGIGVACIELLAGADVFNSMGLGRRQALWQARGLIKAESLPLFEAAGQSERGPEPEAVLPEMHLGEQVIADYQSQRLSLKAHPVSFLRERLSRLGILSAEEIAERRDGQPAVTSGVVLSRQRPGTAKGVVFMTLEDETGTVNVVIWSQTLEACRKAVMGGRLVTVRGRIQRVDDIIHLVAGRVEDCSCWLGLLSRPETDLDVTAGVSAPPSAIPRSRDFH